MPAAISALGWGWRHAGRRRWAVSDLDLEIAPGERVLLLGASGAGKSTLLRGLAGVLGDGEDGDATGTLHVDGVPTHHARGRVGLVLQDPDSQMIMSRVGDDVAFGAENLGVPRDEIWHRVSAALDAVGLDVSLDRSTSALSGGQQQRLALAGALAMRPGLLLLDEPTANLDPEGVTTVRDAVVAAVAASGATLVVVEHRVDVWAAHVDRVVVLAADGGVLADGSPDTVFTAHRATLIEAGVWVPGVRPVVDVAASPVASETLLSAEGLRVGRRPFGEKHIVEVGAPTTLALGSGRAMAITGPNGVGKSTLAYTLAGLLPRAGGRLLAADPLRGGIGDDPARWPSKALLTRIGMVFQSPEHQLLRTTVRDELSVGPRALKVTDQAIAARIEPLAERLRLTRLLAVNPFTLSGGEKRRLTVAAALATAPRVLVLDEPTYGQDARTWAELAALIAEVRADGTSVCFVTHDRHLVDVLADDVHEAVRA